MKSINSVYVLHDLSLQQTVNQANAPPLRCILFLQLSSIPALTHVHSFRPGVFPAQTEQGRNAWLDFSTPAFTHAAMAVVHWWHSRAVSGDVPLSPAAVRKIKQSRCGDYFTCSFCEKMLCVCY